MELTLTYDLRAPEFGAPRTALYRAALEQVAWADELGFDVVGLGEHHSATDGYNPSSLVVAAAMAARTRRIQLRTSVLLAPLYDPVKLAEDAAVVQTLSDGRLLLGIGAGYRPSEFETFGRSLDDRWRVMGEVCEFLRLAWTGEAFEWQGRRCLVTPKPEPCAPPILLGGSSAAAARRAARIADGWFPPLDARLWQPYRDECLALGKADPGTYPAHGPIFLWISADPEAAWKKLMPHIQHQLQSYSEWTVEAFGRAAGPYAADTTPDAIRQSPAYQVLSPELALALAERLGDHSVLYLNPLLAGIDPALSWEMLSLYERAVHPYLKRSAPINEANPTVADLSVHEAIYTLRAMRRLRPDPVPIEDLRYIVEAATMACSPGNSQPWQFIVITDAQQKQRIAALYAALGTRIIEEGALASGVLDAAADKVYRQALALSQCLQEVPAMVMCCVTGRPEGGGVQLASYYGAIYPAIQNLMLAARSRGIGSTLTTLHKVREDEIKAVLGIPESVETIALVPLGYPEGKWGRPRRKEQREVTFWNRWGGEEVQD